MSFRDDLTRYLAGGDLRAADLGHRAGLFAVLRRSRHYEFSVTVVEGGTHVLIAGGERRREFLLEALVAGEPDGQLVASSVRCSMTSITGDDGRTQSWRLSVPTVVALYALAAADERRAMSLAHAGLGTATMATGIHASSTVLGRPVAAGR